MRFAISIVTLSIIFWYNTILLLGNVVIYFTYPSSQCDVWILSKVWIFTGLALGLLPACLLLFALGDNEKVYLGVSLCFDCFLGLFFASHFVWVVILGTVLIWQSGNDRCSSQSKNNTQEIWVVVCWMMGLIYYTILGTRALLAWQYRMMRRSRRGSEELFSIHVVQ